MRYLPVKFIKDAAKSVKRICEREFTKTKDSVLTELLGISSLVVTMFTLRREDNEDVLHLMCSHRNDVAVCPRFGAFTESVHEEKKRCVRHLDIWRKKTFLHFLYRRFKCSDCGKEFTEQLNFVEKSRRQSLDFEMHIYRLCLSDNGKDVAKRESLSQSTVKGIFLRFAKMKFGAGRARRCPRVHWFEKVFYSIDRPGSWAKAKIVRYADDFMILARYMGSGITSFVESKIETWLGLELNRDKTKLVNLRLLGSRVDFLGHTFRYDRDLKDRDFRYLNITPSQKALKAQREKNRSMISKDQSYVPIQQLIEKINRQLRGRARYFSFGNPRKAMRSMNWFVRDRITRHLHRRSQRPFRPPKGRSMYQHLKCLGMIYL